MLRTDLKQLRESLGARGFFENISSLLESKELTPDDFSLRQLWEACVGPTHLTLPSYAARQKVFVTNADQFSTLSEADLGTNLFQTVTGAVVARKVMDSYQQTGGLIGDQLVSVEKSNIRNERIAGFTALQEPKEVKEGMPYEEASFGDKFVTTVESKKGRILSITEEAVHFDQTGEILRRAARLGDAARIERERTIVRGVMDADYLANQRGVYRPGGALTSLYPADGTLKNVISPDSSIGDFAVSLPLVDWTSVGQAMRFHATVQTDDRHGPESSMPIPWNPRILLVPKALELTAMRIVNATRTHSTTSGNTTESINPLQNAFAVLASPFVDQVSAKNWFLGDFPRQFIWKEIWPVQVFRQAQEQGDGFDRDVVARFKVRYYGGLNALDHRYVVKCVDQTD